MMNSPKSEGYCGMFQGMAVGLAEAAKAAGAYRSRMPRFIRTAVNHSIFHAFGVKFGTCGFLLCGGHTIPDFNNINRWHLPLNNDPGRACASNDGLGARKILQREESEDAKEAWLFVTRDW